MLYAVIDEIRKLMTSLYFINEKNCILLMQV